MSSCRHEVVRCARTHVLTRARTQIPPSIVNASYAVAVGYVLTDVGYTGYLERERGSPNGVVARQTVEAFVFQSVASLGIPAFTIHTCVHQSERALRVFENSLNPRVLRWGPSVVGFAVIPFLPMIDAPVERAVEEVFDVVWPTPAGWMRRHHEHNHQNHSGGGEAVEPPSVLQGEEAGKDGGKDGGSADSTKKTKVD